MWKNGFISMGVAAFVMFGVADGVAADKSSTIKLTPADFMVPREKIMEQVQRLEGMAEASRSTADYARLYNDLQDDLSKAKPPMKEWSEKDRDRVTALPEPTDAAWQALRTEQEHTQQRLRQQSDDAVQAQQARLEAQREQQKANRDADLAEQQARLNEAQIRESEARTDYYDNDYYYGGNYWWYHQPWHRPVPRPWENRYYGTKPPLPNNYEPRPMR